MPRCRNDQPVRGVGMKGARQPCAIQGNPGFNWQEPHTRGSERGIEPFGHLSRQAQTPLFHQQGNFPRRNRQDTHFVILPGIDNDAPRLRPQLRVVVHHPYQNVGVENNHRAAAQSVGSAAARNGSSYASTEPRKAPRSGAFSSDCGAGVSTATARPRFVIVIGSPSSCISLIRRRHLALNSAAPTVFVTVRTRISVHL